MASRRGNKEGTIYQTNGKWRAQLTTFKGKRKSHTAETRKECQEWIKQMNRRMDDGLTSKGSKTTFEEYSKEWLLYKEPHIQQPTHNHYSQVLQDYVLPVIGKTLLMDLQPYQIQEIYNDNVAKGIGLRTIEFTHTVIRNCLNHAVRNNVIPKNPALAANPPRPKPNEMMTLNEEEIQTFVLAAQSLQPRNYPFFQLAITTGMRRAEILGLKWEDLEWIRRWLSVNRQLKRNKVDGFYFDPPKTKAGYRTILLGETTIAILREHHQAWLERREHFHPDWANVNLMFSEPDGSPLRYRRVYKEFKALLEEAGLPDIRFHDLRHTAASQMFANKVDNVTVSRRLGHSKVSTTLDHYGHLVPGAQEKAAAVMDDLTTPVAIMTEKTAPKLHRA